jgi:hypothetical protein
VKKITKTAPQILTALGQHPSETRLLDAGLDEEGPAARGGTCPVSTGTGRPPTTGIAAGRWTGPGRRSWAGCGPGATRPRGRTGPSAPIPP